MCEILLAAANSVGVKIKAAQVCSRSLGCGHEFAW
jgi:hypothetical protein